MKNLAKFFLFVLLISAGISVLYDYRLKHGTLNLASARTPEKYTLASTPNVDPKQVASLEALNRERCDLLWIYIRRRSQRVLFRRSRRSQIQRPMFKTIVIQNRNSCANQQDKKEEFREIFHQLTFEKVRPCCSTIKR